MERLRVFRESLKMKPKDMAERLGLEYQTFYQYEKGTRKIPPEVLEGLAGLGLNLNWLATGEGPMVLPAKEVPPRTIGGQGWSRLPDERQAEQALLEEAGRYPNLKDVVGKPPTPKLDGATLEEATHLVDEEIIQDRIVPAKTRWDLISLVAAELADLKALGRGGEIRERIQNWLAVARIGLSE